MTEETINPENLAPSLNQKARGFWKHGKWALLGVVVIIAVLSAVSAAYASAFENKIYPGVSIGPVDVGGLTHQEAAALLGQATEHVIQNGLELNADGESQHISLLASGLEDPDVSFELLTWNIDQAVSEAINVGRDRHVLLNQFLPVGVRLGGHTVSFLPEINTEELHEHIQTAFPDKSTPPAEPTYQITQNAEGWDVTITDPASGITIFMDAIEQEMMTYLAEDLYLPPVTLTYREADPRITTEDAERLIPRALGALESAPYTLTYNGGWRPESWTVTEDELAPYLTPTIDVHNHVTIGLREEFIDEVIHPKVATILTEPKDARFEIQEGRVVEFQGAEAGVILDAQATTESLAAILGKPNHTAELVVVTTEPSITTDDANDLGITEIIGIGVSDFSGSPSNRIENIKNGSRLLNGILVAPGEELSLLKHLEPFTYENGYLPEMVIKGDKIIPEMGGGLCQLGTTAFRAAMNTGLEILQRRNHSLVVSYYHWNGAPGTDATLYKVDNGDGSNDLDVRIYNDYPGYILLTTDVDVTTGTLTYTFWGTSDGREGSFDTPIVSSWISPGPTVYTETTELAPGEERCQSAFSGANTSFTYTVERPDGTTDEQVFTSHYRALPRTCLIGVEEAAEEGEDAEEEAAETDDGQEPDSDTETEPPTEPESET